MKSSVEIKQEINSLVERSKAIVELCKTEVREMTEDEEKEFKELKDQIDGKKEELKALEEKLAEYEKDLPEEEEVKEEEKNNKRNKSMKKQNLLKELREAQNGDVIKVNAETRAMTVTGDAGVHDEVVETEILGILEPLYANSVLSKLGARWFTGLKHGDVQLPVMGAGSCAWEGEIDEAEATNNAFTTVKLSPKRLTAYCDISKMLIAQDTIGVEQAIIRDINKALMDKLEKTIFGSAAGTSNQPAGLLYDANATSIQSYADLADFEADVEEDNVTGPMKYILSPKSRAALRTMIKGTNNSGFVYDADAIDGIEAYTTNYLASNKLIYGNFEGLLIGSWGDVELTIDNVTQAKKGCIRIVINAYFDWAKARDVYFAIGDTTKNA